MDVISYKLKQRSLWDKIWMLKFQRGFMRIKGLIGSRLSTAWLAPSAQARAGQVCRMQHSSVWLMSAHNQVKKKWWLVARIC